MSQLVGSRCALCQQSIISILDGDFCPSCGSPHHDKCRQAQPNPDNASNCTTCGSALSVSLAASAEREQAGVDAKDQGLVRKILLAIGCLEIIALMIVIGALITFSLLSGVDKELALYIGGILLAVGVFIQAIVFGLYNGQSWARPAGIAILVLSVLSFALPFAIIGLIILLNERSWNAYVERRMPSE